MTTYRLANNEDMLTIYENFDLTERIGWPVVVCERKGKIVGFLGTQDRPDMVVAGPLEIKAKVKAFILKSLVETYEEFMKIFKIKEYLFTVSKSQSKWVAQMDKLGFKPFSETGEYFWYKRSL